MFCSIHPSYEHSCSFFLTKQHDWVLTFIGRKATPKKTFRLNRRPRSQSRHQLITVICAPELWRSGSFHWDPFTWMKGLQPPERSGAEPLPRSDGCGYRLGMAAYGTSRPASDAHGKDEDALTRQSGQMKDSELGVVCYSKLMEKYHQTVN